MTDYDAKNPGAETNGQFAQLSDNKLFFKTSDSWHWGIFGALLIIAVTLAIFFNIAWQGVIFPSSFIACVGMSLVIRRQQFDAFQAALRADYVRQIVAHLQVRFSAECRTRDYDAQILTELVSQTINDADNYGVRQAADLQLYLECLALLGPTFDEIDWAASILNRPDLDGTAKMDAIHDHLVVKFVNEYSRSGHI